MRNFLETLTRRHKVTDIDQELEQAIARYEKYHRPDQALCDEIATQCQRVLELVNIYILEVGRDSRDPFVVADFGNNLSEILPSLKRLKLSQKEIVSLIALKIKSINRKAQELDQRGIFFDESMGSALLAQAHALNQRNLHHTTLVLREESVSLLQEYKKVLESILHFVADSSSTTQ